MWPGAGRAAPTVDRRRFVHACVCGIAGFAMPGCASLMTRRVTPVDGRIELALVRFPELTEAGGSLALLPDGSSEPVYVIAQDDGTFVALSPICTHLGCTVEITGERLVCPCHGSTYSRAGAVLQGPAERPLARYPAHLSSDGVLTIDLRSRTP